MIALRNILNAEMWQLHTIKCYHIEICCLALTQFDLIGKLLCTNSVRRLFMQAVAVDQIQAKVFGDSVTLTFPGDIPQKCRERHLDLTKDLKRYIAALLYQNSIVSVGKAAELADLGQVDFERFLSMNSIPVSKLSIEDVMADAKKIMQDQAA
jgi:predicted HTH domain antitoxin